MYQKEYNSMNEQINPRATLNAEVMEKAEPRPVRKFRPAAAIAAVLVVVLMAVPVMAAAMPWILDFISPMLGTELEVVQRSVTNNGITMEVVDASNY